MPSAVSGTSQEKFSILIIVHEIVFCQEISFTSTVKFKYFSVWKSYVQVQATTLKQYEP